ncbi:hypothetical protein [Mycetocola sp.]|jgi:hypothetical protein|uniref:hypothetical protein n=1 Tax=Mycetocola sp. TaxID=1871042 RepID=UPI00261B9F3B|nr:hypothetical protein [Mycetocola sp.]MCU1560377.1 xerC 4 [Mycetocola sp.]
MPGRPRTGIGTFGSISTVASGSSSTASTRVRDGDGRLCRVAVRGTTKAKAVAELKGKLAHHDQSGAAGETVTADMPFVAHAQLWLEDIKTPPERRLAAIDHREPEHLLFFTKYGTPITPYSARRTFKQILEHAGLADRGITSHSFRKT